MLRDNATTRLPAAARRPLTVVVVEDDPLQAQLLAECVRRAGLAEAPQTFVDAESALAFLHEGATTVSGRPDLILLDRCLPGLSGEDFLRCVRADERTRTLPVIMLSNSVEPEAVAGAYAAGANCYIEKCGTVEASVAMMKRIKGFFGEVVVLPAPAPVSPEVYQIAKTGL